MKFLIVEPSPLPILIPLGPKYSQAYSTTDNIIVLYILIFKFLERSLDDKSVWTEYHPYIQE